MGHEVVLTREPGGSPGAEAIRRLLVEGEPDRWSAVTELLLFNAARRDHMERVIAPALARGAWVVSDRFADSTRVYQGATRDNLAAIVDALHRLVIGLEPDATVVVDVDPERALGRGLARRTGEDRFESFGLPFQRRLRDGYLALARAHPERVRVVDGDAAEDVVAGRIAGALGLSGR